MKKKLTNVLLGGDSISLVYGPYVRKILGGIFEVKTFSLVPAGIVSPFSSVGMLARIHDLIIEPKYDLIHLNCGLHDIAFNPETQKIRVPLEQYKTNVEQIFRKLKDETSSKVAWATTTPVIDERHNRNVWHEKDVRVYNEAAVHIMSRLSIPINNLHRVIEDAGKEYCLGPDGVHMNKNGNRILAEAVANFLSSLAEPKVG